MSCKYGIHAYKHKETTQQTIVTLATIIVPHVGAMPHNTCKLLSEEKVVEKMFVHGERIKPLLDVKVISEILSLEPILLSKLSAIKRYNFGYYIKKYEVTNCLMLQLQDINVLLGSVDNWDRVLLYTSIEQF